MTKITRLFKSILVIFSILSSFHSFAQSANSNTILETAIQHAPITMEWNIAGSVRKALVYLPPNAKTTSTPIIFAFHGHGGTMQNMFNSRKFNQLWPDAIFVCPQGLNTPGMLTDPEGKRAGWQMTTDSTNKDLLFFDEILHTLKKNYEVDQKRIFVTGHSNGGGFTYLLLAERGNLLAAIAPTATAAGKLLSKIKPKPIFHLTGSTDPLVKPIWQKQTHNYILKLNECDTIGKKIDDFSTFYPSRSGNPVSLFMHPGGHSYPQEANKAIIAFFKKFGNNN